MVRDKAYRQAEQRIKKAQQEEAIKLDLSNMKLTEIPEAIASLTQLQTLNLSSSPFKVCYFPVFSGLES